MEFYDNGCYEKNITFSERMRLYAEITEKYLKDYFYILRSKSKDYETLCDAYEYSISAGGKRIRPSLVLEFNRICGGKICDALPAAAAIEMTHTFSLIHDDLPCMDDDDFRRGMPSCHKKFGEANALLAGDALAYTTFGVITSSEISSDKKSAMINSLFENAFGMIGGQVIDVEGNINSIEKLLSMYKLKTSGLIDASCVMGVIASGDNEKISYAKDYAHNLGIAFQIIDDILDVISTSEELGKPVGSDEKQGKVTSVTILGKEGAENLAREYTNRAKAALENFDDNSFICELTYNLLNRKK